MSIGDTKDMSLRPLAEAIVENINSFASDVANMRERMVIEVADANKLFGSEAGRVDVPVRSDETRPMLDHVEMPNHGPLVESWRFAIEWSGTEDNVPWARMLDAAKPRAFDTKRRGTRWWVTMRDPGDKAGLYRAAVEVFAMPEHIRVKMAKACGLDAPKRLDSPDDAKRALSDHIRDVHQAVVDGKPVVLNKTPGLITVVPDDEWAESYTGRFLMAAAPFVHAPRKQAVFKNVRLDFDVTASPADLAARHDVPAPKFGPDAGSLTPTSAVAQMFGLPPYVITSPKPEEASNMSPDNNPPSTPPREPLFWFDNDGKLCCGDPPDGFLGTDRAMTAEVVATIYNNTHEMYERAHTALAANIQTKYIGEPGNVVVVYGETREDAAHIARTIRWCTAPSSIPAAMIPRAKNEGLCIEPADESALRSAGYVKLTAAEAAVINAMRSAS